MNPSSIFYQLLFLLFPCCLLAQAPTNSTKINVDNIEIARDALGIPHIFSETDAEAIYGLAWAQCEDNFNILQENMSIVKGLSGSIKGPAGAAMDFVAKAFEIEAFVKSRYEEDIDAQMENILSAYAQAVNRYAELHPKEVMVKGLFPIDVIDVLEGYTFNFLIMTYGIADVAKIAQNKIDLFETHGNFISAGSNAMAYSPNKTTDGKTYLVANPHLPVEGGINFWEVSLHSKEGLEFFGVTFTGGGISPFIGTNRYLGWTHTTNSEDFSDVYELEMHPTKKNLYKYDGEWLELEEKEAKLKVKIAGIVVPVSKKYYTSKYGPTLKNKTGYYSFRNNCFFNIRQAEQWYKMAKSKSYDEFWEALNIQGIPSQTITYADYENNIAHINYGLLPVRDNSIEWGGFIKGNSSKTLWDYKEVTPLEELVYVKNPKCGYVFNCNNTPMDCTAEAENPKLGNYAKSFGILTSNTARAKRFKELIAQHDKVNFKEIKAMRDDYGYHSSDLNFRQAMNFNDLFKVLDKHPELADVKAVLNKWDRQMDIHNKQATIIALVSLHIEEYLYKNFALRENVLPESLLVEGLEYAKKFLMKNYGTLEVELGTVQKMVRGDKELPMYGSPQTLANCHTIEHKKGKIKLKHGDTFIMYARYGEEGLESLQTINLFGNSSKPDNPNYDTQMEMYVKQEVTKVDLDLAEIKSKAERIYHPQ